MRKVLPILSLMFVSITALAGELSYLILRGNKGSMNGVVMARATCMDSEYRRVFVREGYFGSVAGKGLFDVVATMKDFEVTEYRINPGLLKQDILSVVSKELDAALKAQCRLDIAADAITDAIQFKTGLETQEMQKRRGTAFPKSQLIEEALHNEHGPARKTWNNFITY